MSIYRYKGSKVWTMDFMFHAQRIRESTGTRSKTLAQKIQDKRRRALEEGAAGLNSKRNRPLLFSIAIKTTLVGHAATMSQSLIAGPRPLTPR